MTPSLLFELRWSFPVPSFATDATRTVTFTCRGRRYGIATRPQATARQFTAPIHELSLGFRWRSAEPSRFCPVIAVRAYMDGWVLFACYVEPSSDSRWTSAQSTVWGLLALKPPAKRRRARDGIIGR